MHSHFTLHPAIMPTTTRVHPTRSLAGSITKPLRYLAAIAGFVSLGLAIVVATTFAHDLFLKPSSFFLAPNAELQLRVLNGTFTTSEAAVTRDRLRDLRLVGPVQTTQGDTARWDPRGKESRWTTRVADAGTYVAGASLYPRALRLEAKEFNAYLAEDGISNVLADRRRDNELNRPARERYSKHVKALVSVGEARASATDTAFRIQFGYPAELIPLDNPYTLRRGRSLRVLALVDGYPAVNQIVLAGGHNATGVKFREMRLTTDSAGVTRVPLQSTGVWYVKFIRMRRVPASAADSVDYESKWATLTFALR